MTILRRGKTGYLLGIEDFVATIWYDAKFARVGGELLLDVTPTDSAELELPRDDLTLRTHTLYLVSLVQDRISLLTFEGDSLKAGLRSGRIQLPYTEVGSNIVLGGTTEQLWRVTRELVASHFPVDSSGVITVSRPMGH